MMIPKKIFRVYGLLIQRKLFSLFDYDIYLPFIKIPELFWCPGKQFPAEFPDCDGLHYAM